MCPRAWNTVTYPTMNTCCEGKVTRNRQQHDTETVWEKLNVGMTFVAEQWVYGIYVIGYSADYRFFPLCVLPWANLLEAVKGQHQEYHDLQWTASSGNSNVALKRAQTSFSFRLE